MSTCRVFLSIFWIQEPHPQLRAVPWHLAFPTALWGEILELGSSSVTFPGIHLVNGKSWQPCPQPPPPHPVWKEHVSPNAALPFGPVTVGGHSFPACLLLQVTVSSLFVQMCPPIPGGASQHPLPHPELLCWLHNSWPNAGLVRFYMSGRLLFFKAWPCCSKVLMGIH